MILINGSAVFLKEEIRCWPLLGFKGIKKVQTVDAAGFIFVLKKKNRKQRKSAILFYTLENE